MTRVIVEITHCELPSEATPSSGDTHTVPRPSSTQARSRDLDTDVSGTGQNGAVRISAKEDYAVRAALQLALADGGPLKREQIALAQEIPTAFLQNILIELRHAEIVEAQRGRDGGFRLARPAEEITVADIVRAVSGPLATIRGVRPPAVEYNEAAEPLKEVWVALRTNIRSILEQVTLANLAANKMPANVRKITADPAAWE